MALLEFEDVEFFKEEDHVRVQFYRNYHFPARFDELDHIGQWKINKNSIEFDAGEKRAANKFNRILEKGFNELIGPNGKQTIFVHRGMPLVGSNTFGIIDRDTNVLEIKPMTGCNLNCVFCSVDEGHNSKKVRDFLVEEEYLAEEFNKIAQAKKHAVEAHIAGQNEPMLYPKICELIRDVKPFARDVSIDTNGVLLTQKRIDDLVNAGLTRINISINAMSPEIANKMAGTYYDIEHVKSMATYISKKIKVLIAPVYVPGMNDDEIGRIIKFGKRIGAVLGIQNYLEYERGRRPTKQISMEKFYGLLDRWGKEHDVDLRLENFFDIRPDKVLERPFKKNDRVRAQVICPGKYEDELICTAKDRIITCKTRKPLRGMITVRIIREKHNIYKAVAL